VFEKRVLRRILRPKREVMGGWRKLHNKKLHNSYFSPDIIRVIKSRSMKCVVHEEHVRDNFSWETSRKEITWET
jgi:hypothetical protein